MTGTFSGRQRATGWIYLVELATVLTAIPDVLYKEGDITVGGLFSVTMDTNNDSVMFSEALASEALIYALEMVNLNKQILPNITLGYRIKNDADSIDIGVRFAIDSMMGSTALERRQWISHRLDNALIGFDPTCEPPGQNMIALIGSLTSDVSIAVNSVLSNGLIPQVSYASTSPSLSNKKYYPSFLRTVPSDEVVAEAIAEILFSKGWTYVLIFASDNMYGTTIVPVLKDRIQRNNSACVGQVVMFSPKVQPNELRNKVTEVSQQMKHADVYILATSKLYVDRFFKAVGDVASQKFWIITDILGDGNFDDFSFKSPVPVGSIGLEPIVKTPNIFYLYLQHLSESNRTGTENPWLQAAMGPGMTINDGLIPFMIVTSINRTSPVISAALSTAFALDEVGKRNQEVCSENCLTQLFSYGYENETGWAWEKVGVGPGKFDLRGNVEGDLLIKNYQYNRTLHVNIGFKEVGWFKATAQPGHQRLSLDWDEAILPDTFNGSDPISVCHQQCQPGTFVVYTGEDCCFTCFACTEGHYTDTPSALSCMKCSPGKTNNSDLSGCVFKLVLDRTSFSQIMVYCFTGACCLLSALVWGLFYYYRNTPVFVCGNVQLTTVLLTGLSLTFSLPFIFAIDASPWFCLSYAFLFTLLYSTVTAVLVVKTWTTLQIFNMTIIVQNPTSLRRKQLLQCGMLSILGCLCQIPYAALHPVEPPPDHSNCGPQFTVLQLIGTAYVMFLLVTAALIAFRARNLPSSYNEMKYISLTAFCTFLIWIVTIPTYYVNSPNYRVLVMSLMMDSISLTILLIFFLHKLWIVWRHPEKNTQAYVRQQNALHVWNSSRRSLFRRQQSTIGSLLGLKQRKPAIRFKAGRRRLRNSLATDDISMIAWKLTYMDFTRESVERDV